MIELNQLEISVLRAMHSRNIYGAKHIRMEKVIHSGFPSHLRGDVKKAIYSLIKKSFILYVKRSKDAIQLNLNKNEEIKKFVSQI